MWHANEQPAEQLMDMLLEKYICLYPKVPCCCRTCCEALSGQSQRERERETERETSMTPSDPSECLFLGL